MDLFTHVLVAALIGIPLGAPLKFETLLYVALAGSIPDADVFASPLEKRFRAATHHGGSHSILFILIYSLIAPAAYVALGRMLVLAEMSYARAFLLALVPGLMHIFSDLLTSWSVPLLWPFSSKGYKFELDRAIDPVTILFSIPAAVAFYLTWPNAFVYWAIVLALVCYFGGRCAAKLYVMRHYKMDGSTVGAVATNVPTKWFLVHDRSDEKKIDLEYRPVSIFSDDNNEFKKFTLEKRTEGLSKEMHIDDAKKAMQYSYHIREVQAYLSKFKYPLASANYDEKERAWIVAWSAVEMTTAWGSLAVVVRLSPDRRYSVKRHFTRQELK